MMSMKAVDLGTTVEPYYSTAARRAYLVVPEIGVLKWFLGSSSIASVNLGSESRFRMLFASTI